MHVALRNGIEYPLRQALLGLGRIAAERERWEDGATFLGAGRRNLPDHAYTSGQYQAAEQRCRAALGDDRFDELSERGRALSHEQLLDLAPPTPADRG